MYAILTTPGFVIDSRPLGEADKLLHIFTRDFGLVTATAQGIRLEKSKLRYYCQDYAFGVYSLVRGREFWRLTSAYDDSTDRLAADPQATGDHAATVASPLLARVAQLLRRLIHGEESHPELFECVAELDRFCRGGGSSGESAGPDLTDDELKSLESLTVYRILDLLGYIGHEPAFEPLSCTLATGRPGAYGRALSRELLAAAALHRHKLNAHINKALKESHL